MTPAQCRAARALLGWSGRELAATAEVNKQTVVRFEAGESVRVRTVRKLRGVMESAGVLFLDDAPGPGVRFVGVAEKP